MERGKGWRVPVGRFAICQAAMLSEGWVRVLCLRHAARLLLPLQLGFVCCALGYVCCAHDGMLHACCCRYSWGTVCSEALSSRMVRGLCTGLRQGPVIFLVAVTQPQHT